MSNKATHFSRVEGGKIKPIPFDFYESELSNYKSSEKKQVYSHALSDKVITRVFKINNINVHGLFFEDGKAYDAVEVGFKLRKNTDGTHIDYTDQLKLCK